MKDRGDDEGALGRSTCFRIRARNVHDRGSRRNQLPRLVPTTRSDVSRQQVSNVWTELTRFSFRRDENPGRGSRVRELRSYFDASLETGRHRPLPLQRLRALLQDERPESTPHQAETTPGKYLSCLTCLTITVLERVDGITCGKRSIKMLYDRKNSHL